MTKKNNGKDFLFSDDCGFINSDDGSDGYKYSDGLLSASLEGLKYTEAVQRLKESSFSNVHTKEISDLTISYGGIICPATDI